MCPIPTYIPHHDIPFVGDISIPPPTVDTAPPLPMITPPPWVEEIRGRSRSRSRSPSRTTRYHGRSRSRSHSRSRSPSFIHTPMSPYDTRLPHTCWRRSRAPTIIEAPPIPPVVWPTPILKHPVDILTFHYNKNMAYAPAAQTYDEAINTVLELWSDLREVERDRIKLLVTGSDHLVQIPRMAWQAVLCDLPRYEVVHVQVDQLPPPPQYYQGKGKGKWGSGDEKGHRSTGLFSSIKNIFSR